MNRFLIPVRFAACLLWPALAETVRAAETVSDATPADDLLKKQPEGPQSYFSLATTLRIQLEESFPAAPPAELTRRVTLALESAIAGNPISREERTGYLPLVAYAAVGDPRWHGLLRNLFARQPSLLESPTRPHPRVTDNSYLWHAISNVLGVVDSGRLIPDVALHLSPKDSGQGILTWSFQGLMPPAPSEQDRIYGGPSVKLPWRSLAAPLAGQFDALIFATSDQHEVGEQMVARLEKLSSKGEISLTGLPRTGQLHLRLIQREAPHLTTETMPMGYNTLPLLMDTSNPPAPSSPQPNGWQLLCEPCALTGTQWLVNRYADPATPWPLGVALLLLDESNQVCTINELDQRSDRRGPWTWLTSVTPLFSSATIAQTQFSAETGRWPIQTSLRITGPPRRLALARSIRREIDASNKTNRPPRFTVQESPVAPVPNKTGSLEILRFWHLPGRDEFSWATERNPAIRPSPLQAAWYVQDQLNILDLEKEGAPLTLKLNVPPGSRSGGVYWTGPQVHVEFLVPPPPGMNGMGSTLLFTLDPDSGTPPPEPYNFQQPVSFQSLEAEGIEGAMTISSEKAFYGVLSAEGRILALNRAPDSANPPANLIPRHALTATSLVCAPENDGPCPVLDWSDGTLRLRFETKLQDRIPRKGYGSPFRVLKNGIVADTSVTPPEYWQCPLGGISLQFIDADRAIGRTDTLRGIVLLRKVRSKP